MTTFSITANIHKLRNFSETAMMILTDDRCNQTVRHFAIDGENKVFEIYTEQGSLLMNADLKPCACGENPLIVQNGSSLEKTLSNWARTR